MLFETDLPHPTALYPNVQEHIVELLGGQSREVVRIPSRAFVAGRAARH